ncbi:MAG: hypothetical protein QM667_10740 [Asticcacaulis sp.]
MEDEILSNAERLGRTYFFAFIDDDLDWDSVLAATQAHLTRDPHNRFALHNRAQAMFGREDFVEAERLFRASLNEGWDEAMPYYAFGQFLSLRKRPRDASDMFAHALRFEPDDAALWRCLAYAHSESWRFGQAAEAFTRAIVLEPDFARTLADRGWAYAASGRLVAAFRDWSEAARLRKA